MDEQQARDHIRDIFESSFEKSRFVSFVKNLLNQIEDIPFTYSGGTIPKAYRQYISTLTRIGKYTDGDNCLDILIVRLQRETSLERARTMQRNFIAWYLNGSRGGVQKDAALVAFVSPTGEDWRFSLVKMDYRFEEKEGKVKVKEEFTPARRFSFLVGEHENSHTAQSRLVPILADDGNNPTFADLEEAFNIEKVSDEFFQEYRRLFIWTKEELDKALLQDASLKTEFEQKGVNTVDFGKKLLGQIVFLYYLQKKGWFGVPIKGKWGDGSKQFLRELFDEKHGAYHNFFNDILEHLFYAALRNDRSHDGHYFSRFNCKIPFLNGGLFDPMGDYSWVTTDILLPNALFSNQNKTKAGDIGDGILDVFDRFNFTVWEEEPLEKEVAVDPEMLGKVFENLLEVRDRKSKGAFYTPREIVHYMCQESLINYLDTAVNVAAKPWADETPVQGAMFGTVKPQKQAFKTVQRTEIISRDDIAVLVRQGALALQHDAAKEAGLKKQEYVLPASVRQNAAALDAALAEIKICDPAIGSGAFPVGMLHEIVGARRALGTYLGEPERPPYPLKRHAIQESIYGVDVDPGAVEIAKLRLWLSLVVDEEDIHHIRPLPNLDYKVMVGNSLIEIISPEFLAKTTDQARNRLIDELEQAKNTLFNLTNPTQKKQKRAEIERLIAQLFENYKTSRMRTLQEKLDGLQAKRSLFANARPTKAELKRQQKLAAEIDEIKNLQLPGAAEHFEWHINFSEVFQTQDGFDVVIGNPPYVRQELLRALKPVLKKSHKDVYAGTADLYVYFYSQGAKILREQGMLAYITSNKWLRANYGEKLRQYLSQTTQIHQIIDFGELPVFDAATFPMIWLSRNEAEGVPFSFLQVRSLTAPYPNLPLLLKTNGQTLPTEVTRGKKWLLTSANIVRLIQKMERNGQPLSKYVGKQIYRGVLTGFNKAFVIDEQKRAELIAADSHSAELIKPLAVGNDVRRWQIEFKHKYLIVTPIGINMKKYPAIFQHLSQWQPQLEKRHDQGKHWWELRACNYYAEFDKPKIVYPEIAKEPRFAFDISGAYTNNKAFIIPRDDMYLLGVLNSSLAWKYATTICAVLGDENKGGRAMLQWVNFSKLPIPNPDQKQKYQVESLVRNILETKTSNPVVDVAALEAEIDQLVYQLYGLSNEEIAIVEGHTT